jgi:hypothetical protein
LVITYTPADYQKELEDLENEAGDFGFVEATEGQLNELGVQANSETKDEQAE